MALKSYQAGPPAAAVMTEVMAMESYQMAKWKDQAKTAVALQQAGKSETLALAMESYLMAKWKDQAQTAVALQPAVKSGLLALAMERH